MSHPLARPQRFWMLDLAAAAVGLYAFTAKVAQPLLALMSLRLRTHGPLREDLEFYFGLSAVVVRALGQYAGLSLCILGITLALSSRLGLRVGHAARLRARLWFWMIPTVCFGVEMLGRYMLQALFSAQGLRAPSTQFIQQTLPHLLWLALAWLLLAPAVYTGRGLYLFRPRDWRLLFPGVATRR